MAAVVAVALSSCTIERPPDAQDLTDELVAAVGSQRYIEGRVPGGFRFGPAVSRYRSGPPGQLDPPAILSVLAKAEAMPSRHTPPGLLLRGVARLLAGRIEQSISVLSLSAAAQPSAPAWAALSAAYLEAASAKPDRATELSVRALDAAEQALALDESLLEAWFNRAAAAAHLPPCEPDETAWQTYVARESHREWRAEGQRRLRESASACGRTRNIGDVPGHLRARIEEELLPAWASAWSQGHLAEADSLLGEAGLLASTVGKATGEPYTSDLVRTIAEADKAGRNRLAIAWTQYGHARDLFDASRDAEATGAAREARRSSRPQDGPLWSLIELHLATLAQQRRQIGLATTLLEGVAARAEAGGYPGLAARAGIVRALVRTRQGRLSDAAREYREAGDVLERLHEPDLAAAAYGGVSSSMRRLNDPRGTWTALARTLGVLDRVQSPRRRYVVLYNASLVAQQAGATRAALLFQNAAVDVAEERQVAGTIVEAYTRRAELRERLRPGSGAQDLQMARARAPKVTDENRARYYSALLDAIEGESLLSLQPAAARERFGRALDFFADGEPAEVPRLLLGRGRAHWRVGDAAGARGDFLAGIKAFEAGRLKVSAENRVAYFDLARELFDEMIALSQGDPRAAFAFAERGRALTVVEALGGPVETDVERVAAQLPPATALVQYAALPDRVMIWAVTADGTRSAVVSESRQALEQRVLSLLAAIADEQGTTDVTTQAEALYGVLLRPVEHHLQGVRQLVIVGDGSIHRVPFALLRSNGRYLMERFGLVNALSASAFLGAERKRSTAPDGSGALVVGNPAYDREQFEGLRPLPSAEREAAAVAGMYPRRTLLTRHEATRARFLEAAAASRVIHFGGHAVIDLDAPERSALLLATGGGTSSTVTAPEIARLKLTGAPVVVLAACSTATGAAYRMEGATSLSRAFLLAGASNVVGSLWDIEDEASEAFFVHFHRRLAAGDAPAAALRAAQIALLHASDPRIAAPRAWAAFQLIGALSKTAA